MEMEDYTELRACVDCLHLVCNGEAPEGFADEVAERWPGMWLGYGWADQEDETDLGFSWRTCECCGSTLGGDRFKLHAHKLHAHKVRS